MTVSNAIFAARRANGMFCVLAFASRKSKISSWCSRHPSTPHAFILFCISAQPQPPSCLNPSDLNRPAKTEPGPCGLAWSCRAASCCDGGGGLGVGRLAAVMIPDGCGVAFNSASFRAACNHSSGVKGRPRASNSSKNGVLIE